MRRNWLRIVVVSLAVTGAALALAWLATPHYKASTRLLIEMRESVFTRPDNNSQAENPILDEEGVTSQVEVISSTDILKQVATKLDLSRLREFDEAADMGSIGRFLVIAGLKSDPHEIPPDERVLKAMREKLNVFRVERSRVIVIEFSSEDAKLAAEIPNAIADAYISVQGNAKVESNSAATDWLAPEITDLSKRVKDAEARVAEYRAQSGLLMGGNNSVLATQQLSELSTELSRVRASRASAEATAESVRAALRGGGSLDAFPEVLSSSLIQRLREQQVQLKSNIADLSTTLLGNHPRIRALQSQLADLDSQIRNEAQKVLKGLTTQAQTAQMRENQLVADLNKLKAESARVGEEQVELNALEREANSPAPTARILPDPLPRGVVALGSQLSAGRCPRLFTRGGALGTLFPEDRADRRRCLRGLAADHGGRDPVAGTLFRPRHAPGAGRPLRAYRGCGDAGRGFGADTTGRAGEGGGT